VDKAFIWISLGSDYFSMGRREGVPARQKLVGNLKKGTRRRAFSACTLLVI
jgi:hypothetical protein